VVLLNFWASWCTPCRAEAPLLEKTQEKLRRHRGTVLGITYLDVAGDSREFVRGLHVTYPNLRDSNGDFAHSYGTDQLPESFVIDRAGDVVAICRGEIGQTFMNQAVTLAQTGSWKPVPC
jgi:cytochrome c biogenesis protein CcmG/thiol:disulfide interchange protein DsbE